MQNGQQTGRTFRDDEIDLRELWTLLLSEWKVIAIASVISAFVSLAYAFSLTEIYRSEALLAPAESGQPSNPLLNQFGAAAGLIGINVPENDGRITSALATLQSRQFIKRFIASHQILPCLFTGKWNSNTRKTEIDSSLFDVVSNTWLEAEPTEEEAYKAFRDILFVSESPVDQMVSVAIEWYDPALAQQWVEWLVNDINDLIKEQDQQEARDAIEYLQDQLASTQLIEMQSIFYQLIESQMRIVMLADVRDEYIFRIVDPAFIPEEKIRPRKSIIVIFGAFAGLLVALMYLVICHYIGAQSYSPVGKQSS